MLKKTIKYSDFDGNEVIEDFYFNLNKAEIAEMEFAKEGGMANHLRKMMETQEPREIIPTFKAIIEAAVGERSPDGKRFIKNQDIRDGFMQTDAYPTLFMELITAPESAAQFIIGILPSDLSDELAKVDVTQMQTVQLPEQTVVVLKSFAEYTGDEILAMLDDEFIKFEKAVRNDYGALRKDALVVVMQRKTSMMQKNADRMVAEIN